MKYHRGAQATASSRLQCGGVTYPQVGQDIGDGGGGLGLVLGLAVGEGGRGGGGRGGALQGAVDPVVGALQALG